MADNSLRILVSGAAGQIGYALLPLICSGQMFGPNQRVSLNLFEVPFPNVVKALGGVNMELEDCAYTLVDQINQYTTKEPEKAFKDIDYAILVGGFPRKKGMLRADLLNKNSSIFTEAGKALEKYAKKTVKVLVVANPANTNCLVAATNAPSIPKENFCALTRLDYNRATGQIAKKMGTTSGTVKNIIIWGNHSKTQVPDTSACTVNGKAPELDKKYLESFRSTIQQRGKAIIDARSLSSAMSAANAVKDCIYDWHNGTKQGCHVAMSVWSNKNPYGVADGLFYSFPVTVSGGKWTIVKDIKISDTIKGLMSASEKELLGERETVTKKTDTSVVREKKPGHVPFEAV